ncbi:MAG: hypothetical protein KAS49_04380, partial [Candidatus Cloacimonetes bacterium]|nr:hypothetical protein [Candidatus Cloacimonadota bacterium]
MKKLIMVLMMYAFITMVLGQITTPVDIRPKAPVEFDIKVSNEKVYVGDSIDVYVIVTLSKEHPDYEEGRRYEVVEVTNYRYSPQGPWKESNPLWEVLYSDKNVTIDDNNPAVNFHYVIKLNKLPRYKDVGIMTPKVVEIGEMGIKRINRQRYIIKCLNEGLPEKSMRKPGDIKLSEDDSIQLIIPSFKISEDGPGQRITPSFKIRGSKMDFEIIKFDSIKPCNDSTINKKAKDADYYNYLINEKYYLNFDFGSNEDCISSVDCPSGIADASKNISSAKLGFIIINPAAKNKAKVNWGKKLIEKITDIT